MAKLTADQLKKLAKRLVARLGGRVPPAIIQALVSNPPLLRALVEEMGMLIGAAARRDVIAELLRAGRTDLANVVAKRGGDGPPLPSKTGMRLREDLGQLPQFSKFTDDAWVHLGNHVKKYGDTRIVFTGALQTLLAHAYRKGKALPMTEDYGVRWMPKDSYAMKVQYADRYLGWLDDAGIVERTEMPARDALKANHTKKDMAVAKENPTLPVTVYVAGETLPGIIALLGKYGAKLGAVATVEAANRPLNKEALNILQALLDKGGGRRGGPREWLPRSVLSSFYRRPVAELFRARYLELRPGNSDGDFRVTEQGRTAAKGGGATAGVEPELVQLREAERLPVGSIVTPWINGRPDTSSFLIIVKGGALPSYVLPEKSRPVELGTPLSRWGAKEWAVVKKGTGKIPTKKTAQRAAITWFNSLGRASAATADYVKPDAPDRQAMAEIEYTTSNGTFKVVVGPVNPRWKVRPIELYEVVPNEPERFLGYVAPDKMRNIPNDRRMDAGKGYQLLKQKNLLPLDPVAKPLSPGEQEKVRSRIRKKAKGCIALIQFFDAKRRWREAEERAFPNNTLFILQRPDGMWLARYKQSHGTTTSGDYMKGPLAAALAAMSRAVPDGPC